ncbi:MFS transporter [Actinomadura harenae]|uniref:DHA2 family efflux MFS transporter permease subunit n=1 Tax=Actinomadura harenae TaxID=2483351 RepID=A0A3M2M7T7_9ACTN|nr:MFS transporter [Actinomadura harenae]RMI44913.1 DHA2 family efflux MFS transporter permease subunit [Actinomadura harenae]
MSSRERWLLALTATASLMIALDALVVTTSLHAIELDLHASIADLEWTVNAYTVPFAVLLMAGAALGERHGRRQVLVGGLVLFGVASAGCALAPNLGWLIAARAVQGAGAAAVAPTSLAVLAAAVGPERRPRTLGLFASITGLATAGGPLVGGAIVQNLTWQWIFWVNVPIAVVLVLAVLARIDRDAGSPRALDLPGIALISGAAFGLVWALIRANGVGWGSVETLGALVGGAVALVAFVVWEVRGADAPLVPMRFFAARGFSAGNSAGFLLFSCTFSGAFFFAQLLQIVLRHSPLTTGLLLLPWTVTLFVVAPVAGAQITRVGARTLVAGGMFLQAVGFGWVALIAGPGMSYPPLVLPFAISGVGLSMAIPAAQSAVIGAVPPAAIGAASGTFNTVRQLGGAFGIAITTAVFTATGGLGSVTSFADGFTPAITTAAALALIGAAIGLTLPRRTPASGARAPEPSQRTPAAQDA